METIARLAKMGSESAERNGFLKSYINLGDVGASEAISEESICSRNGRSIFTYRVSSSQLGYFELEGACLQMLEEKGQLKSIMEGLFPKLERRLKYLILKADVQHFRRSGALLLPKKGKRMHNEYSSIDNRPFPQLPILGQLAESTGKKAGLQRPINKKTDKRVEIFSNSFVTASQGRNRRGRSCHLQFRQSQVCP